MSEHLPKTHYLDPELLQALGDLELVAREVVEGLRATYAAWEATAPEPAFKSGWTPEKELESQKEEAAYKAQGTK